MVHISIQDALDKLRKVDSKSKLLFKHGTMSFKIYKPELKDIQQPHEQDEIYVITSGNASFCCDGEIEKVKSGDFLFAPAGIEHRFIDFSEDFSTWVIFYGPQGGE